MTYYCPCDACTGNLEPPGGEPCYFPNPDRPDECCGDYEGHEGDHGYWFRPIPVLPADLTGGTP